MYPIVIGGVYFAFGEHPFLVQLLQSALLGGTCWLVFDMGRRVFDRRSGMLAGIACAFQPMMLRYVADLQLETQLAFLFTLTVWCTVRVYQKPTIANGALVGVAAGFAAPTKGRTRLFAREGLNSPRIQLQRRIHRRLCSPALGVPKVNQRKSSVIMNSQRN
jgi:4-amino-4-deoxy-L-arabinose transferase-like glycosyltransferase